MKWNSKNRKGISYKRGYMGFNTGGHTTESLAERDKVFIAEMKAKTFEERVEYWENVKIMTALRQGSWDWTWCTFQRTFVNRNKVIM